MDTHGSRQKKETKHAGSVCLCLQAGREAFANARGGRGPSGMAVAWLYTCGRIIALLFVLRSKELRSARLVPAAEHWQIHLTFHPKGDPNAPRVAASRWAFGVLGVFQWWPGFFRALNGQLTLTSGFDAGYQRILSATRLTGHAAPKGISGVAAVLARTPEYGVPETVVSHLNITGHSDHGTLCDLIRFLGVDLGFDVIVECVISGHWRPTSETIGASGRHLFPPSSMSAPQRAALKAAVGGGRMPGRYGDGPNRDAAGGEGPRTAWKAISFAYYAIHEQGIEWRDIDPNSGWAIARAYGDRLLSRGGSPPFGFAAVPPFPSPAFLDDFGPAPPVAALALPAPALP